MQVFANASIASSSVDFSLGQIDIRDSIKSFWDEMATLLYDYSDLSLNPDPTKWLQIGNTQVSGDQVESAATAMLIEDRLAKIEMAQSSILDIWDKLHKMEERLNNVGV